MDSERIRIVIPGELKRKALEAARTFRKNPTPSEAILWQALRGKKLNGIKFRRQQPIGPFIVDFYAPRVRLVVEVDGVVHEQQKEADQARQDILESLDLQFLRFSATQVESDIDSVLSKIRLKAEEILRTMGKNPTPRPSPTSGEGRIPHPLPSPTSGEGRVPPTPGHSSTSGEGSGPHPLPSLTSRDGSVPLPRSSGKGLGDEVHRHE